MSNNTTTTEARPVPIREIDASVFADIEGVVFDVDDTLTRAGRLEDVAFAALWRLHEAGMHLISVTGRPLGWADVMARHWPIDIAVAENGAGWVYRGRNTGTGGEAVLEGYFHDEPERQQHEHIRASIRAAVRQELPQVREATDQRARRCDVAFDIAETVQLDGAVREALRRIIVAHGARVVTSSVHMHGILGDWNKASGVVRAAREVIAIDLRRRRDHFIFIGDSPNDADAFAFFPKSVGVANVMPLLGELHHRPAYVTEADRGRGFAELAAILLAAGKPPST